MPKKLRDDDKICVISQVEGSKYNDNPSTSTESNIKVPIFVLHPSGTHYIPMCIDSSLVSHAFKKPTATAPCIASTVNEPSQCHPVSIPVNFNPLTASSDSYELDIQNINVIGSRHQTSAFLSSFFYYYCRFFFFFLFHSTYAYILLTLKFPWFCFYCYYCFLMDFRRRKKKHNFY